MSLVQLDKVNGKSHLISGVCKDDLPNGTLVAEGDLRIDGESFEVAKIKDVEKEMILLHYSEPFDYVLDSMDQFVLRKGKVGRFYLLEEGAMITLTNDLVDGKATKDKFVVPQVGNYKGKVADTVTKERLVFQIKSVNESLMGQPAMLLEVVKGA